MSAISFWIWPSLNGLSSSAGASTREMSVHQPWKVLGTSILIVGPSSGSKSSSFFSFLPNMPAMAPRRAQHQCRSVPGPVGEHLPLREVIFFIFDLLAETSILVSFEGKENAKMLGEQSLFGHAMSEAEKKDEVCRAAGSTVRLVGRSRGSEIV